VKNEDFAEAKTARDFSHMPTVLRVENPFIRWI
jgi:hypothetical protein